MTVPSLSTTLTAIDLVAVAVFAITGALTASRKQLDLMGFLWLATVTAIGGGTVRDVLIAQPVFWVVDPTYVIVSAAAAVIVYLTAHLLRSRYRALLWLDAIGLAFVSVSGAAKTLESGLGPVVAVVMGVITASLGGIIRDVLGHEPSILLRREIYITASLLGALTYVIAMGAGLGTPAAVTVGLAAGFLLRAGAIARGWSLPTYRARPGRDAGELQ